MLNYLDRSCLKVSGLVRPTRATIRPTSGIYISLYTLSCFIFLKLQNIRLTHFSDIIGASHSADYRVWEYGGIASDGLRQVAEWGSTQALESELKSEVLRTSCL
jgi:hypothetical protein